MYGLHPDGTLYYRIFVLIVKIVQTKFATSGARLLNVPPRLLLLRDAVKRQRCWSDGISQVLLHLPPGNYPRRIAPHIV